MVLASGRGHLPHAEGSSNFKEEEGEDCNCTKKAALTVHRKTAHQKKMLKMTVFERYHNAVKETMVFEESRMVAVINCLLCDFSVLVFCRPTAVLV